MLACIDDDSRTQIYALLLFRLGPRPTTIPEILGHDARVVGGDDSHGFLLRPLMFVVLDDFAVEQFGFVTRLVIRAVLMHGHSPVGLRCCN